MSFLQNSFTSLQHAWHLLAQWWLALPPAHAFALSALLVALWLLAGGGVAYYLIRLGLGHHRFRGRWYTARQWRSYLERLEHGDQQGIPLDFEDARVLDKWRERDRAQAEKRSGRR